MEVPEQENLAMSNEAINQTKPKRSRLTILLILLGAVALLSGVYYLSLYSGRDNHMSTLSPDDAQESEAAVISDVCPDGNLRTTFFSENDNSPTLFKGCDEIPLSLGVDYDRYTLLKGNPIFSADRSKVLVRYMNNTYSPSNFVGMFGPAATGMVVVDTDNPTEVLYRKDPTDSQAYTYIEWSPNGRYISYLLEKWWQESDVLVILDLETGKEIFNETDTGNRPLYPVPGEAGFSEKFDRYYIELNKAGLRPISWRNSQEFSYVSDGVLYLVNIHTQEKQVIDREVTNRLLHAFEWEGIDPKYDVLWSPDGRYAMYHKTDHAVIRDMQTDRTHSFSEAINQRSEGGTKYYYGVNIRNAAWLDNRSLIYTPFFSVDDNYNPVILNAENGLFKETQLDLSSNPEYQGGGVYTAANKLLLNTDSSYSSFQIFNIDENRMVCSELEHEIYSVKGDYQLIDDTLYILAQRGGEYIPDKGYFVYNLNTCNTVASYLVE